MNDIEYKYCDNCKIYRPIFDFKLEDNFLSDLCIECLNEKLKSIKPIEDAKKELENQEITQPKSF